MTPAAVIVSHRGGPLLARCVAAMRAQSLPVRELLVVLSTDQDVPIPADVRAVRMGRKAGFAEAANVGLRAIGTGPVLLLNDDTVAEPDFVQRLSTAATQPGIYQPRIMLATDAGRIDNTGHRLFPDGFNFARGRNQPPCDFPAEAGAFSGAAVLFTPEVLETVGLFDEDFDAFGEDLDLSLRARRAGFRIHYVPDAIIHHELGATYGRVSPRKIFLVERNRTWAAVRSLPLTALGTMPAWTGLRLTAQALGAATGRGLGAGAGLRGAAAVIAGNTAGLLGARRAWKKRAGDKHKWSIGEREMIRHLRTHRARSADLLPQPPASSAS
jgi:GT2 family glycosyltransferase